MSGCAHGRMKFPREREKEKERCHIIVCERTCMREKTEFQVSNITESKTRERETDG